MAATSRMQENRGQTGMALPEGKSPVKYEMETPEHAAFVQQLQARRSAS